MLALNPFIVFDFSKDTPSSSWTVVDDGVMGGLSEGRFFINSQGHGVFEGNVSLANNGGFSLIRHRFAQKSIDGYQRAMIRLKGDGKRYQFRIKANANQRHSYIAYFDSSGEWETITISLKDMYPAFRGRTLNLPNYSAKKISEIAFLIGNEKEESFRLEIDRIWLE
ncbi:MAG: CIA30 family protein [Saprospiraceae bacterium]|nr:CIA30 family protein [Saprospiraceae bacterium]